MIPSANESDLLGLIASAAAPLRHDFAHVLVGPGDDAAVLRTPAGDTLLATVDQLVEARHFLPIDRDAPNPNTLDLIARKAVARSVSDIAAMGGSPAFALATACLPRPFPAHAAEHLALAVHRWGRHWSCPVVGGDLASSADAHAPLHLSITVLGYPHPLHPPALRSNAKPGHAVFVTGALGGSLASGRHLTFEPRLDEARHLLDALGPSIGAMIDLSDGLGRDAGRIAHASNLRLTLHADRFPLNPGCDWRRALADGEDYELLFTAPPDAVPTTLGPHHTPVTRIGEVTADTPGARVVTTAGDTLDADHAGWDHH
ncbi:MAG: thiamine-monophosphate kinase [Phycisphaeraceae bacterium]|nr:MAG: thiamine-monophosphate kinase [Phycisphaeraceae bacterium]